MIASKEVINPVDVDAYAKAVNDYNSLPIEERKDWRKLIGKPYDNPTLYETYNGDDIVLEYALEILPEWSTSDTELDVLADEVRDIAEDFYNGDAPEDIFKQDLKLVVVCYDFETNDRITMDYDDFLKAVGSNVASAFSRVTVDAPAY